jgi:hypothetical protein
MKKLMTKLEQQTLPLFLPEVVLGERANLEIQIEDKVQ